MDVLNGAQDRHILVIDDDKTIRELLCEILAEEGYRVSSSLTSYDDLDLLHRLGLSLIVLDIVLGDQEDGLTFIERLKSDPRTRPIPVMVCTAALHLTDEINARLVEWDCLVIAKPFDLDALLDEIDRCLEDRK